MRRRGRIERRGWLPGATTVRDENTIIPAKKERIDAKTTSPLTSAPLSSAMAVVTMPQTASPISTRPSSSASAPDIVQAVRSSTMTRVPSCPTGLPATAPPTETSSSFGMSFMTAP